MDPRILRAPRHRLKGAILADVPRHTAPRARAGRSRAPQPARPSPPRQPPKGIHLRLRAAIHRTLISDAPLGLPRCARNDIHATQHFANAAATLRQWLHHRSAEPYPASSTVFMKLGRAPAMMSISTPCPGVPTRPSCWAAQIRRGDKSSAAP
jgi:hypothetical protein